MDANGHTKPASIMEQKYHIIDPDGEVILVLRDANPPFAVWTENEKETEKQNDDNGEPNQEAGSQKTEAEETLDEEIEEEPFRIRVSAKHLTLASPVFKSLLLGGWKESSAYLETGSTELDVYGWDLEALLILLRIIHCKNKEVPRKITLELFTKVAVLVDFYRCKDVVDFFANVWLDDLMESPCWSNYSRELCLWLCIAWVFRISDYFEKITAVAIKTSGRKISNLGLPLPAKLIDGMNHYREKLLESVLAAISKQRDCFLRDYWPCSQSWECTSMLLGGLEKHLFTNGFTPTPMAPFLGFNYTSCVVKLRSFQPPIWYEQKGTRHNCSPSSQGYDQLKLSEDSASGLNINYYF